jgi:nucleoside-diphosphate-sugar epimerase
MTTLVTGAAGFLGSHVVDLLVADGEHPRVLIRPGESEHALREAGLEVHSCDIGDRSALEAAVTGADRIIHCAARTGPWGPEHEYQRTNVLALDTLLDVALSARVRRIVHVSSIVVHGTDVGGVADESAPLRADNNPYSRTKVAGERLLMRRIREQGAPVTIVRPGWIYGPGDSASFGRVAETIETGRMVMLGRGGNHVPLIHVRDAARGCLLASEAPDAHGKAYLLVNDQPVTQRQFVDAIAAELDVPAPRRRIPYQVALGAGAFAEAAGHLAGADRPPPLTRFGVQLLGGENRFIISRARRDLGFSPAVGLAEGVRDAVAWYRTTRLSSYSSAR